MKQLKREHIHKIDFKPWLTASSLILATLLLGCVGTTPVHKEDGAVEGHENGSSMASPGKQDPSNGNKRFEEPGELDKLLDAKPLALTAVKLNSTSSSSTGMAGKPTEMAVPGRGKFRIQIGSESDMDAAQAKKGSYEKQLGGTVDMVFDAPYYKLRWGSFNTKQDAEDKILELSEFKIQGFVVKQ